MTDHLLFVTGASSGIGKALAEAATADGATVATVSRRPGPGHHLAADLADPGSWTPTVTWMGDQIANGSWDRVSFVHSAATLSPIGFAGEVDNEEYASNVILNSASGQVLGGAFVELVEPLGVPGVMIMVSSGAGKRPITGWASYCAAKASLDMWVQAVGLERTYRDSKMTVVSVGPGVVATDMQAAIRGSDVAAFPDVAMFQEMHAQGQLASPEQVGAAYWGLCQRDDLPQGGVFSIGDYA